MNIPFPCITGRREMTRWQKLYEEKTITAGQAADMIKSGDRIMTGNRDCRAVLRKLMERKDLENVYYYAPIIKIGRASCRERV